jgi:hypothetical protein
LEVKMANWKLQYRLTTTIYADVVVGPDPTVLPTVQVLTAKKMFLAAAERLNGLESGEPMLQAWRRVLSDLDGYEYVGVSATNTPTSFKSKLIVITTATASGGVIDEAPTSAIRTSLPGVFPATVRGGSAGFVATNSVLADEDRGGVTGTGGAATAVERKEWRVVLS